MNDALQRLRAANPVTVDPQAPPIDDVRTRIAAADEPVPAATPGVGGAWAPSCRCWARSRSPRSSSAWCS
jgi:hypothetical protein